MNNNKTILKVYNPKFGEDINMEMEIQMNQNKWRQQKNEHLN